MYYVISIFAILFLLPAISRQTVPSMSAVPYCNTCGSIDFNTISDLVVAANDTAVSRFTYDGHRVTRAETLVGEEVFDVAWLRDAGGLVTNLVCGSDMSVAKTYDLSGRLTSLRVDGHEWTFAYDAENRLVGGASPDGVSRSLSYDAAGRISSWSVGSLAGRAIIRDAAGRRIRDTVTAGPMPRSPFARSARNVFDAADRLVSASVVIGGRNVPITETYLYDGNGALTNILADGESVFNASYDASGRLVSLGTNGWHCAYDALGNRVRMGDRIFLPDYDDPLKRPLIECAADGSVIRRYLWSPTGLLGFIDADGALTVAHSDEQGSVIALTDIDGNVLFRANYGPYGEDWGSSGFNPTPFFWLGGLGVMKVDPIPHSPFPIPHSLYLTRHRLYSPVLRRFLSADPLGFAGGANVYLYANGNPLAYVDPLGLCAELGELGFLESIALGASMGDFADDTGVGGTVGQIGVGLIPIAGQIADARDTAANFVNVWNNPSSGDAWIGLAMSGVAWVPGAGDAVKAAYKGGKQVAKKSVKAVSSVMTPVRTLQTGGHTLNSSTLRTLGVTREQGQRAIEALKRDMHLPHDFHGKIMSDGSVFDNKGNSIGNIYDYLP